MSKIKNSGLDQYGAKPFEQLALKGLKTRQTEKCKDTLEVFQCLVRPMQTAPSTHQPLGSCTHQQRLRLENLNSSIMN